MVAAAVLDIGSSSCSSRNDSSGSNISNVYSINLNYFNSDFRHKEFTTNKSASEKTKTL